MSVTSIVEEKYCSSVGIEHRRKYAQFFTPIEVAKVMSAWLLGNEGLKDVLDPAAGLGVFSRVLLSEKKDLNITGYEIDGVAFKTATDLFKEESGVSFIFGDYLSSDWNQKYDGIICNPPYFKFHDYDNRKGVDAVNLMLGTNLRYFTNQYALFLLKSLSQLKPNGRCAYIVPSEFMNSDYGVLVKEYLKRSKQLRHIIVVDFKENIFTDALTTSAIILCANDNHDSEVSFLRLNDVNRLDMVYDLISSYPKKISVAARTYKTDELKPEIKWRNYYSPQPMPEFRSLVPFSTYAKVMRGIATGANDYFSFNKSKIQRYGISFNDLQPCICHSTDVKGIAFSQKDFMTLYESDKRVYILNPRRSVDENLKKYITKGTEEQIDKRYLTACRRPWYSMEKKSPAPIWVGVFNRKGLRFVRNETDVVSLTTFHGVYVNPSIWGVDPDLLFAYLISDTAHKLFSKSAREYGNGLSKFEPNDLNNSSMLDLGSLDESVKNRLRFLYLANKNSESSSFIKQIDSILIDSFAL